VDFSATTHGGPVTRFPHPPSSEEHRVIHDPGAKPGLRARLRAHRREHVAALDDRTRGLLFLRPPGPIAALIPEGSVVGLYRATPVEAPTRSYAAWLIENGRTIALPWFAERGAPMRFRRWRDPYADADLIPGPHGVLQPGEDAEEVEPQAVFVPLLGFTTRGDRLGQGGGHYDRWLADHPQVTAIGLAWDCQLLPALPVEAHDHPLAAVVTPTRLYQVGS
jgi:5-formyltetrahydrofolate cyclo-ligase